MTKTGRRNRDLRRMLSTRQHELQNDVQGRLRDGRADRTHEVGDELEHSDDNRQEEIGLALLQMKAETLVRIDEALARLEAGDYGSCFDCAGEISEQRLRALPFAVRCRPCEEIREEEQGHARRLAERRGSVSTFPHTVSP